MKTLYVFLQSIFSSFGPILVFYISNHFWGLQFAVITSIVWCIGEISYHKILKKPLSTFFKFSAVLTLTFGVIDIYLQQSIFFKYEAAMTNLLVGCYFASTLFSEKSIIREFAEAQGRIPKQISKDGEYYFRFLTLVWAAYSVIKALFYAWVASNYSLEEGLVVRGIIGNSTFYGLLFLSIFGSKPILYVLGRLRLLPSTR